MGEEAKTVKRVGPPWWVAALLAAGVLLVLFVLTGRGTDPAEAASGSRPITAAWLT